MATKRVKIEYGEEVDSKANTMAEDRISQLPDRLIHLIFSFLPTIYIVRMSILSWRWKYLWLSTPFIYLDFNCITYPYMARKRVMFLNFVTNRLRCRKLYMQVPKTSITSFKCIMSCSFESSANRLIDDWLSFVVRMKVKELDLCGNDYCLPQFVLRSSSLTVLKLGNMKLEASSPSVLPSLKVLSLCDVICNSKSFQNLISGCPVIEDLHLIKYTFGCSFMGNHYLGRYMFGVIDLAVSGTLKNLSLCCVEITDDQWLDRVISRFPLLERLTFRHCKLKNISIHSQSLKYLFCDVFNMNEADLRTPNLVFLHLKCFAESNISVEASQLLEVSLYLYDFSMNKTSYHHLVRLLSNLRCLKKKMTLTVYCQAALIIQKGVRKESLPPLPNLKHLTLNISGRLTRNLQLQESLLWCAPSAETIEIYES